MKKEREVQKNPLVSQIASACCPPIAAAELFATQYHKGNIFAQLEFMLGTKKIIHETFKTIDDQLQPLDSWEKLDEFFTKLMGGYKKNRGCDYGQIELLDGYHRPSTKFEFSHTRAVTNCITTAHLHVTQNACVSIGDFVERCEKYFNISLASVDERDNKIAGCRYKDYKDYKIVSHTLGGMSPQDLKIFCSSLLKIIYDKAKTREKRIDAIFALMFLYGSKPHVIFAKPEFYGGAFATDFLLQYLLASIGEKPIGKNYLTLTEVELLLLFAKDDKEAWQTPRKCYLEAADNNKSNLFFHHGDTFSLLEMLVSDELKLVEFAEKNDAFRKPLLTVIRTLLSYLESPLPLHETIDGILGLRNWIRDQRARKLSAIEDAPYSQLVEALENASNGLQRPNPIQDLLLEITQPRPACAEALVLSFLLTFFDKRTWESDQQTGKLVEIAREHPNIMQRILAILGPQIVNHGIAERMPTLIKLAKNYSEITTAITEALKTKDIEGQTGLHKIAQHTPDQLADIIEIAQGNDRVKAALAAALSLQTNEEWTALHMIAGCAPNQLAGIIEIAKKDDQFKAALAKALLIPNKEGKNALECIRQFAPQLFDDFFKAIAERAVTPKHDAASARFFSAVKVSENESDTRSSSFSAQL